MSVSAVPILRRSGSRVAGHDTPSSEPAWSIDAWVNARMRSHTAEDGRAA